MIKSGQWAIEGDIVGHFLDKAVRSTLCDLPVLSSSAETTYKSKLKWSNLDP
jgi:hypothetical protein